MSYGTCSLTATADGLWGMYQIPVRKIKVKKLKVPAMLIGTGGNLTQVDQLESFLDALNLSTEN